MRDDGLFVPTWIGAAFDLPGRADLDALGEALGGWTLRHETLRSGFRWAGGSGDEIRRFTLDADAVSLHREDVGEFTDAAALTRHLQHRFDTTADAMRWPNLIYTAVVRDDSTSVYMAFDHSNVDAYSIHRIPGEVRALYESGLAGGAPGPVPVSSCVDFCEAERANADRIDADHEIVAR